MSIYDDERRRAEAERDHSIDLAVRAYEARLRAIGVLEAMASEGPAPSAKSAEKAARRLKRGELDEAFDRILPKLDDPFDNYPEQEFWRRP